MTSDGVQIMAKPVCGRCNLDCGYCYYREKPRELYPEHPAPIMPQNVLESYIRQCMTAGLERTDFCWQGGEPLLAGKAFFRQVVEYQKQFGRTGQTVGNALQTNGTLLDDEWCEFFQAYSFFLGISLDGPASLHNRYRKDTAGRGSFDAVWRGLQLLGRHRLEFNVLVTLHAGNIHHGTDLYRFLINRGLRYVQFIPILERNANGSPTDFSCPPGALRQFLLQVFELWVKDGVGRVSERFFDSVLSTLVNGRATMCWNLPECPRSPILEWNGDLYVCDHFVQRQWRQGNILDRPIAELANNEVRTQFARLKTTLSPECRSCEFLAFCHGGCPKHYSAGGPESQPRNYFCEDYRQFFRQALPEFKRIARSLVQPRKPVG